jgi:hypothetical protein
MRRHPTGAAALLALVLTPAGVRAQGGAPADHRDEDGLAVRFSELKVHGRWSEDDRFPMAFPFPPDFVPVGEPNVAGYRFVLGDRADPGDLFPALQPAIRFSRLENAVHDIAASRRVRHGEALVTLRLRM